MAQIVDNGGGVHSRAILSRAESETTPPVVAFPVKRIHCWRNARRASFADGLTGLHSQRDHPIRGGLVSISRL